MTTTTIYYEVYDGGRLIDENPVFFSTKLERNQRLYGTLVGGQ